VGEKWVSDDYSYLCKGLKSTKKSKTVKVGVVDMIYFPIIGFYKFVFLVGIMLNTPQELNYSIKKTN
jgi:hypothetical protein